MKKNSRKTKKILVICQYYYPENFQITPICEQLVKDGYQVTVLTGLPNYPTGIIPEEYLKGKRKEIINGVRVLRCHEVGRKKGPIYLALNYMSFMMSASRMVKKIRKDYDIVFVYQLSPITMGLPGRIYSKKNGIPLLIYVCDLWPESVKLYVNSENSMVFRFADLISKRIYYSADRILLQSNSFSDYMKAFHKIEEKKMKYIPGFADESYLKEDFIEDNGIIDFVFLGNLGIAQDLISVLEAVKQIKDIPNIKVHFVGDGTSVEEMKKFVKRECLEKIVLFYGRRPVEEMPKFYQLADACLVSLKSDNKIGLTLPSKVQGYMAAGKPILAMVDGSTKDIIEKSGCGICVKAGDIYAFAEAMRDFAENTVKYKDCGKRGREYFKKNFTQKSFMEKLENEIELLTI